MILPEPSQIPFTGISRYRREFALAIPHPAENLHRLSHKGIPQLTDGEFRRWREYQAPIMPLFARDVAPVRAKPKQKRRSPSPCIAPYDFKVCRING